MRPSSANVIEQFLIRSPFLNRLVKAVIKNVIRRLAEASLYIRRYFDGRDASTSSA